MGICRYGPQQQIKHQSDWCGKHQQVEFVELPVYDILTDQTRRKPGRPKKC